MATGSFADKKTVTQKLSDLVEWFVLDQKVELKFVPIQSPKHRRILGSLAPEFDFHYYLDGRRITERCLAMVIVTKLQVMDYNYNIAKVLCALTALAWKNYVATCPYPEWMVNADQQVEPRRPPGRPRKHPKKLPYEEEFEADEQAVA